MLTADKQREFSVCQYFIRPVLNVRKRGFRRAEAQLYISAVEYLVVCEVLVLIGGLFFDS